MKKNLALYLLGLVTFGANHALEKDHKEEIIFETNYSENFQEASSFTILEEQDKLLNSLKGITALQIQYVNLKNPGYWQALKEYTGTQGFRADSANLEDALDGTAQILTKKLENYERVLLELIKKIDSADSGDKIKIESLAKTIEKRWSEFADTLPTSDMALRANAKDGALIMLLALGWPYIFAKTYDAIQEADKPRGHAILRFLIAAAVAGPISVVLGGCINPLLKIIKNYSQEKSEAYCSEALKALYQQLEIVNGVEELLNATLIYQKHRELRKQRFLALSDQ